MREEACDILVVGGGLGGCAAALAACEAGHSVIMTEPTIWVGGQLTAQAVPPDEHPWIESQGCTGRYRTLRESIRSLYRRHYPLNVDALADPELNPGSGFVSRLCCEPRAAVTGLRGMLMPYESSGRLRIWRNTFPRAVDVEGDVVRSVTVYRRLIDSEVTVSAKFVLDASELGDLLPLANVEHVTGCEAQRDTGEMHAKERPEPENEQAITWVVALGWDRNPEAVHTIDKPEHYEAWRAFRPEVDPPWPGPLLSWREPLGDRPAESRVSYLRPEHRGRRQSGGIPYFDYRKVIDATRWRHPEHLDDVTLVNWVMNDYIGGSITDVPTEKRRERLNEAKELTRCLVYWLQTEAEDFSTGKQGLPRLYPRPDIMGSEDGLALAVYIRESRRIRALQTITEGDVAVMQRCGENPGWGDPGSEHVERARPLPVHDSVGVGAYRIDLHISTGGDHCLDLAAYPFQIPLGALIPVRLRNLLPACKNIGTTHITNGAFRLHPVEWNIGESAGILASFCIERETEPHRVHGHRGLMSDFQKRLADEHVQLEWHGRVHAI
ncbi:FAD-dependent oxidoreductase [Mucisphaera calidilacus]|uniref:FAD dependent oxidoreductase n=1 Tax=Mucisphaera calidilacus TaxID=2527982 RepID=A0A518BZ28_9BACT|nr:FAD-dependent oxidoreductase [Mucisphaera calidilacus]QDU72214.1 FAD dependent oxidoreductase [Mucisphaera calidilacus]